MKEGMGKMGFDKAWEAGHAAKPLIDLARSEDAKKMGITEEQKTEMDKLAMEFADKAVADFKEEQGAENMDTKSENKKEKLNSFGLPENWAKDRSLQALDFIRKNLADLNITEENKRSVDSKLESILEHVFTITSKEYNKYRKNSSPSSSSDLTCSVPENEWAYLKIDSKEKLDFFKKRWPEGLKIKDTGKHIKWEKVLDYDLWCMGNHGQTLASVQRRGGLSTSEILSVIFGLGYGEKFDKNKVMQFFKDNNMLAD